jgi:hypothetical protein
MHQLCKEYNPPEILHHQSSMIPLDTFRWDLKARLQNSTYLQGMDSSWNHSRRLLNKILHYSNRWQAQQKKGQ